MVDNKMESVPFPGRKIAFIFEHDTIGDGFFSPMLFKAVEEFSAIDRSGEIDNFTASNGVKITVTWPEQRTLEQFDKDVEDFIAKNPNASVQLVGTYEVQQPPMA